MTTCRPPVKVCKKAGAVKLWGFDYKESLANLWEPNRYYAPGVKVRPTQPNGFQAVSTGGTTALGEPRWPKTNGGTVNDGSTGWTMEPIGNGSLRTTIVTSVWTADAGIVVSAGTTVNTNGEQSTNAQVSSGTADAVYDVRNTVTFADGTIEISTLEVTVQE